MKQNMNMRKRREKIMKLLEMKMNGKKKKLPVNVQTKMTMQKSMDANTKLNMNVPMNMEVNKKMRMNMNENMN
jgi:hypothetical protein